MSINFILLLLDNSLAYVFEFDYSFYTKYKFWSQFKCFLNKDVNILLQIFANLLLVYCIFLYKCVFCKLVKLYFLNFVIFFFFFSNIFFLLKIFYNREAYFINYNLQTNKQKIYHPLYLFLRLLKTNLFCLLPHLNPIPPSPDSKTESDKMTKSFGLQNIFN